MTKGTIIYLMGADTLDPDFEDTEVFDQLGYEPKESILAASADGFYSMHDATRMMIVRGAKRIEAIKAVIIDDGAIRTCGEPVRVFG